MAPGLSLKPSLDFLSPLLEFCLFQRSISVSWTKFRQYQSSVFCGYTLFFIFSEMSYYLTNQFSDLLHSTICFAAVYHLETRTNSFVPSLTHVVDDIIQI